ncbi:MAG: ribosome-associated heat shock protein Hsp15 [Nocardioidaceae bacterium]|nr:ribosome-associated heat shock protein Hsp15 [Nocardioidaceae bacterium]
MDATRIDRWLWAVRLSKTRSDATALCKSGHVDVNGRAAKPATTIAAGDRIEARLHGEHRTFEVVQVIDKRVGAPIALECYVDHTPPPPPKDESAPVAARERGAGRPTKRDRRDIDRLRS